MTLSAINIEHLLSTLRSNLDLPVIFSLNEQLVSPGYHISEVKQAQVDSLDCGRGTAQWQEFTIQVLDGNTHSKSAYMHAAKMLAILEQVINIHPPEEGSKLYFEYSPDNTGLSKSNVSSIDIIHSTIVVYLNNSPAQCKPLQRWLEKTTASEKNADCCASAPVSNFAQPCCSAAVASTSCCA
jgi:hypothetical protein